MSDRPTEPGRPTGPPSGPLSGPTRPGSVPPPPPEHPSDGEHRPSGEGTGSGAGSGRTGGGGPGDTPPPGSPPPPSQTPRPEGPGPDRPWWRFTPKKLVGLGVLIVAAVVLTIVLTSSGGGGGGGTTAGGELFLQSADSSGPDPYTASSTHKGATATTPTTLPSPSGDASSQGANIVRGVEGSAPGLYGGTRNVSSCDVEKQISALGAEPDKNKAFASVLGIDPSGVPAYLRSLTPVQLRLDTRVTNHGFRNGAATTFQSVLQSGTAVLVNDRGEPRVRCSCGNPLLAPVPLQGSVKREGKAWSGYKSSDAVVVSPAAQPVNRFVMYDPETEGWFTRNAGTTGAGDMRTTPRTPPSPSAASKAPSSGSSQSSQSQSQQSSPSSEPSQSSQPPSSGATGSSPAPPSGAKSPAPKSPASQPAS
ncbi:DUF6777 domain-containing protein [Streptomyces sp. NPDC048641]|uniref:DUF6777 domain-containing protein n=1 Tax=Streptomyces sp. NPDC048641 TaxID=3154825 RepID=UPI0034451246